MDLTKERKIKKQKKDNDIEYNSPPFDMSFMDKVQVLNVIQ